MQIFFKMYNIGYISLKNIWNEKFFKWRDIHIWFFKISFQWVTFLCSSWQMDSTYYSVHMSRLSRVCTDTKKMSKEKTDNKFIKCGGQTSNFHERNFINENYLSTVLLLMDIFFLSVHVWDNRDVALKVVRFLKTLFSWRRETSATAAFPIDFTKLCHL